MTTLNQPQSPRTSTANLPDLLDELLHEQQHLTAVEKFSQFHESATTPLLESRYRELIPATPPVPGQQYAFEVNLDDCSGCKACVTACHNLNGLEADELWRSVGLLSGGTEPAPMQQHVTTACHHCVEPGCLEGCPVMAYDKDPLTGIVRHLDDQCIGCQYCMLMCPYEVPQYSQSKGIVRKCDMCSDRLAVGEAPACVQSCPHEAIRIATVSTEAVVADCETDNFLPGAPDPTLTLPTTKYNSSKSFPRNTLPADYYAPRRQHAHWPLIVMLVLTQMSIGTFLVQSLTGWLLGAAAFSRAANVALLVTALVIGLVGLQAAIFHLGRPLYAFRALLGLRTSWMSREILAFNLFAAAATSYTSLAVLRLLAWEVPVRGETFAGVATCATGVISIFCSVMIYGATKKHFWRFNPTATKFFLSAALLGAATSLVVCLFSPSGASDSASMSPVPLLSGLVLAVIGFALLKMLAEASVFRHLLDRRHTQLRRSAILMSGALRGVTLVRYGCGLVGGVLLPLILLASLSGSTAEPLALLASASLGLLLAGEVAERYQFFAAIASAKMPGTPAP